MTIKTHGTIQEIQKHGLENALKSNLYVVPELKQGEWVAQGDLNFIGVNQIPSDAKKLAVSGQDIPFQLAPGNSKGSRHVLTSLKDVDVYEVDNANALIGYWLDFKGSTVLDHPEHKNQLWRSGKVLITYQRQHAEELRRIED